ncbi:MAG: hypothetical protein LBS10_00360 [Gracilibacteraceae bacterium]|jgi:hypothetical protein|nr:hypothetical protein [Gracilibacteraceae bacterium]
MWKKSHSEYYSWTVRNGVRTDLRCEFRKLEETAGLNDRTCTRSAFRTLMVKELAARPEWSLTTKFDAYDTFLSDNYKMTRKATEESDKYSASNDIYISVLIREYTPEYMRRRNDSKAAITAEISFSVSESDLLTYRYANDGYSEFVSLAFILLCLDKAASIADKIPQMIAHQEQLEMIAKGKEAKRKKIREIREENVLTVLERICSGMKMPYAFEIMSSRIDLKIKLPNRTHIRIEIPFNKYKEILPDLEGIIQNYMSAIANSKAKVLIVNNDTKTRWQVNDKTR